MGTFKLQHNQAVLWWNSGYTVCLFDKSGELAQEAEDCRYSCKAFG